MKPITPQSLGNIASSLGLRLVGDPSFRILNVASLATATKDSLSFFDETTADFTSLETSLAGAVLCSETSLSHCPPGLAYLVSPEPRLAFAKIVSTLLIKTKTFSGIHPSAILGEGVLCAEGVVIGPGCVLGAEVILAKNVILEANVVIGAHCRIEEGTRICAGTVLYEDVHLGKKCLIHSGCVIGSEGFGFVNDGAKWLKIPQLGGVRIGNGVEIGANTTIDCGALQDTIIEDGVILDNQIQIGHNVHIGAFTAIAGCVGIAGSTKIGRYCLIGGGSCIGGHLKIADKVHLAGMSSVSRSISQAGVYSSLFPVKPNRIWKRNLARFNHLEDLALRVKRMERNLALLKIEE